MRLTILGCSGSVPGPGAAASGYLVEADGFVLAVEFGNGVLAALQEVRDPFELDAIALSHLHADHCGDMSSLTVYRRYHPVPPYASRPRRLPVFAPQDAASRLAHAYAASAEERETTDLTDAFTFLSLERPLTAGPLKVTPIPVLHPVEAFGLRIEHEGTVLAYTGDTADCPELDELASGADALLAEATWTEAPDRPAGVHLSAKQAGALAERAGAKRLLLTHIPPWQDTNAILAEASAEFTGPTELVSKGAEYTL